MPSRRRPSPMAELAWYLAAALLLLLAGGLIYLAVRFYGRPPAAPETGEFILITSTPSPEPTPTVTPTPTITPTPTPLPAGWFIYEPVTPPPSIYPPTRDRAGFNFGGQVHDFTAPDKMKWAGMGWVKFQVNEGDVNAIDKMNRGHAKGFRVLLSVVGNRERAADEAYYADYAAYVANLAANGAEAIEVWNEPNLDRDWATGNIDPGLYAKLLKISYEAIKAANPNTLVLSAGLASTLMADNLRSDRFWTEVAYSTEFVAQGGLYYADCLGVHYNVGTTPPTQTDEAARGDAALKYFPRVLQHYTDIASGTRPICITELGYLSPEGYPSLISAAPGFSWAQNITVKNQADWLSQAVNMSRNHPLVEMLIVWNVDFWAYGADPHAGYAIVRPGGGCPACDSLHALGWP